MAKPLVLITHRFDPERLLSLRQHPEIEFHFEANIYDDPRLSEAVALISRSSSKWDQDFFNKAKNLKFLVTATSGFDHIDLVAAEKAGVQCYHVPESQTEAAAELTIFMLMAGNRKITRAQEQMQKGDWQRSLLLGKQVSGQTLGIIGLGRVGMAVAKKAQALGLKVVANDPYITEHDPAITMLGFEELMRTSDIVSLHVPKTNKTRQMIKRETLQWMNDSALLINMSRGDVVNEADLVDHLTENPNFRAGLDVFAREPLVTKSRLFDLPNVTLTPHIGASTEEALKASSQLAVEKVEALLKGQAVTGDLPPKAPWWGD